MEASSDIDIVNSIRDVISLEAQALQDLVPTINAAFVDAVKLIHNCSGKVVLTGIGKSGHVARKIAATMTSTGTLAIFLHPSEASHGDLGVIRHNDIVIAIGKSGESDELNSIFLGIKRLGAKIIGITSNSRSTLAVNSDVVLYLPIAREACPNDLAPTTSTTLTMAVGDALAITLMNLKGFRSGDFAAFHPGGKLGRRLLLRVKDLMIPLNRCASLDLDRSSVQDSINALTSAGLGVVLFLDQSSQLRGIFTDGDLRNLLNEKKAAIFDIELAQYVNANPFTIDSESLAVDALEKLETARSRPLNVAPVVANGKVVGVIRTHELVRVV